MFDFLDFITDIKNRLKPVTFSESIIRVWIDYYTAYFLEEMSAESRETFSELCFSEWTGSKSERSSVSLKAKSFEECADYISHIISAYCKDKLKERLIMAHRMSVSGYSVDGIARSIGCNLLFTTELLDNHRHVAERIFRAEKENEQFFSSKGYKNILAIR